MYSVSNTVWVVAVEQTFASELDIGHTVEYRILEYEDMRGMTGMTINQSKHLTQCELAFLPDLPTLRKVEGCSLLPSQLSSHLSKDHKLQRHLSYHDCISPRRINLQKMSVTYSDVMSVTTSWDKAKATPNFEKVAGEAILTRMFQLEPKARELFGFSKNEVVIDNPKFGVHSKVMVDMLDLAVSFLGPDLEPIEYELLELGQRHVGYGVTADYLPVMERAVMYALEGILEDKLTREDRGSWQVVFHFIIDHMTKGIKKR
jgi:hemoglobin-like flavoprotein